MHFYSTKPHWKRYCDSATIFETNKTEIEKCSPPDVLNHRLGFVNNEFDQLFCCVAVSNCQKRLLSVSKRILFISDIYSLLYVQTDLFVVFLPEPFLVSPINLGKRFRLSLSWFIIFAVIAIWYKRDSVSHIVYVHKLVVYYVHLKIFQQNFVLKNAFEFFLDNLSTRF